MASLLYQLGLRQPIAWDPPTLIDQLLASPVRTAARYLWQWLTLLRRVYWRAVRRHAPLDVVQKHVRVVCLSDTHDMMVPNVPDGDLLIHAGDLTNRGTPAALQQQLDWLAELPHEHKVVVCGNHDTWFDPAARAVAAAAAAEASKAEDGNSDVPSDEPAAGAYTAPGPDLHDLHYLEHAATTLTFSNGSVLTVYGAPDIPRCGPDVFAFQYERSTPPWEHSVPDKVDILVTHDPPRHHLDLDLGCIGLLHETWRVRPLLHVFGHVHWGAGQQVLFWDGSQRAYETLVADADDGPLLRPPGPTATVVLLGRLLGAAVASTLLLPLALLTLLMPGGVSSEIAARSVEGCTVLVNAAQMHGNTGRLGHNVQVVDL